MIKIDIHFKVYTCLIKTPKKDVFTFSTVRNRVTDSFSSSVNSFKYH